MAKRLLLRDAENLSADMLQRVLGGLTAGIGAASGVGTGFNVGGVGNMNSTWLGATLPTGHLVVTANGTTMVLTMLPGWATVLRDAGAATFDPRAFFAESDANDTVTVTANATGSTRNDTVCLKIDQATAPTSDGSNLLSFVIIAGASGGGLSNAPADGNLYLPLANVAVANGATSIAQANVTDKRMWMPSLLNPYRARAHPSVVTSVTFADVQITLGSVDSDPNGNFSASTYFVAVPGDYLVVGNLSLAAATDLLSCAAKIFKNGVLFATGNASQGNGTLGPHSQVVVCDRFAVGDTIKLFGQATTTTNNQLLSDSNFLSIRYLGSGL